MSGHPEIIASIRRVKSGLARLSRPAAKRFLPGVEPGAVSDLLGRLRIPMPEGLAEWYSEWNGMDWRDGDSADDLAVIPGFYLLSLEDAGASRKDFKERLKPGWLPLLENAGGDVYAVEGATGRKTAGMVHFCPEYDRAETVYDSLAAMAASLAACLDQGIYHVDANGDFEIDDDGEFEICGALNPRSAYWK